MSKKISSEGYSALARFVPDGALPLITPLLKDYSVLIKVKKARSSKFGDYRPLRESAWQHQITVNNDLNKYAFLVTLVHEIAHMHAYARYKGKIKPHGTEWKNIYAGLLRPFIHPAMLPEDLCHGLHAHLDSPKASSCTDHQLFLLLKKYDEKVTQLVLLENLEQGARFRWRNGMVFRKAERVRKRYRCTQVGTEKLYLFHPMAEVERLDF